MLDIIASNQFKKDLKLAKKRGLKLDHLNSVINTLAKQEKLADKYRNHNLNKIAARWPAKAVAQFFSLSKKGSRFFFEKYLLLSYHKKQNTKEDAPPMKRIPFLQCFSEQILQHFLHL